MHRPTFAAYLRVIKAKPGFWLGILSVAAFTARNVLVEGFPNGLIAALVGLALVCAAFPWWRRQAAKDPARYTWRGPNLLEELSRPAVVHPTEPNSNVHPVDGHR